MPPRRGSCDGLYMYRAHFIQLQFTGDNSIGDKLKTTLQEEAVSVLSNSKAVKPLKVLQFKVCINMKLPLQNAFSETLPAVFINASDVFYVSSIVNCVLAAIWVIKRRFFKMLINSYHLSRRTVKSVVTWLASIGYRRRMGKKTPFVNRNTQWCSTLLKHPLPVLFFLLETLITFALVFVWITMDYIEYWLSCLVLVKGHWKSRGTS